MIVSFSKEFIFFKPIKTAGSSVEEALSKCVDKAIDIVTPDSYREGINHTPGVLYNHIRQPEFISKGIVDLQQWQRFHKITICRNPWDKQVSSFWYIAQLEKRYAKLSREEIQARYPAEFKEHILRICRDGKEGQRSVSREFFFYQDGNPFFDTCLRFEHLQDDFSTLGKKLGFTPELPRLKSSTRLLPLPYRDYYTDETQEIVKDCYREVIDFFDYSF